MHKDYYTKLSISLETFNGDGLDDCNDIKTTITSEMSDCNVHAWFQLFEQVLAMAGFEESVIMQGGAQLAFNERRGIEAMRRVADLYDLKLAEDATTAGGSGPTPVA